MSHLHSYQVRVPRHLQSTAPTEPIEENPSAVYRPTAPYTFLPKPREGYLTDHSLGYTVLTALYPHGIPELNGTRHENTGSMAIVTLFTVLIKSDVSIGRGAFSFSTSDMWIHGNNIQRAKWSLLNGTFKDRMRIGEINMRSIGSNHLFGIHQPNIILVPKRASFLIQVCRTMSTNYPIIEEVGTDRVSTLAIDLGYPDSTIKSLNKTSGMIYHYIVDLSKDAR